MAEIGSKFSKVTIGSFLASRLEEIGVEHYFVVPGDYNMSLLDEILKNKNMQMISCCNELNAGYAADGYARARGVGAVFATFMVGSLSLVNAIAGAYSADLPVIVISGGPNSNDFGTNRTLHHTMGTPSRDEPLAIFKQITAEAVIINHAMDAPTLIDRAISTALIKSKPVYIEICCNLATQQVSRPLPYHIVPIIQSNPKSLSAAVDAVAEALNNASKPVLLAGYRVRATKAAEALIGLADVMQCAVATMPDAKGLFPEQHESFIGTYWGSVSSPYVAETIESSDCYLFAGPVFNDYTTVGYTTLIKKDKMIEILPDRVKTPDAEFGCVYMAEFLRALSKAVKQNDASLTAHHKMRKMEAVTETPLSQNPSTEPLRSAVVTQRIQELLLSDQKYGIITETGDSWFHGQKLRLPNGAKYEVQMQYGSTGWSVGALLGYSLGLPEHRIIGIIGDGSFQVSCQEVSTLIRYNRNVVIFLINNYGYTIETQIHAGPYNKIKNWDYAGLVDVFNDKDGYGLSRKVNTEKDLVAAIAEAQKHDSFSLIECTVDPDDCTRELREWGGRVATASNRAPKFAEDF